MGKLQTGPKCPSCAKASDFIRRTQRRYLLGIMIHLQNYARKLRGHIVAVILITMIPPLSARSDDIPTLDVRPVCRGIASLSADPLAAGLKATFEECVKSEQGVREQIKQAWPTFSEADKKHCIALAKTAERRAIPSSSPVWKCPGMYGL
jgi:hypothetical protein